MNMANLPFSSTVAGKYLYGLPCFER